MLCHFRISLCRLIHSWRLSQVDPKFSKAYDGRESQCHLAASLRMVLHGQAILRRLPNLDVVAWLHLPPLFLTHQIDAKGCLVTRFCVLIRTVVNSHPTLTPGTTYYGRIPNGASPMLTKDSYFTASLRVLPWGVCLRILMGLTQTARPLKDLVTVWLVMGFICRPSFFFWGASWLQLNQYLWTYLVPCRTHRKGHFELVSRAQCGSPVLWKTFQVF